MADGDDLGSGPQGGAVRATEAERAAMIEGLLTELSDLRAEVARAGDMTMACWAPRLRRYGFLDSAANLADWLALRRVDLSALQPRLARLGLSSLGRLEGHVRPSIDAVLAALAGLSGAAQVEFPADDVFDRSRILLDRNRDQLFGQRGDGPRTRIMVTLPSEAAEDGALVRRLVQAGVDCFRINCAHDGPDAWAAMIGHIRRAGATVGRHFPVSMDLAGPKFRIASVRDKAQQRLHPGDRFLLARDMPAGGGADLPLATLSHPALLEALKPGSNLSIDDGKLRGRVASIAEGAAVIEVTGAPAKGVRLKPEKGVNLPGADIRVSALTDEDLSALDFVVRHADIVAYSFVQTVEDVRALIAAMEARAPGREVPGVMLKIETPRALRNLPELIVEAGGRCPVAVMIARGDLAVEIGFERLSEIQEELLWLCEAAHVPVVWATQVLEGMVKEGQASRAEVTDAAMGQRAECVMLNKGPHIVEAVVFLRDVLARMDRHQSKKSARLAPLGLWQ